MSALSRLRSVRSNRVISAPYFAFRGGLNLVDPPIQIQPGMLIDSVNYEAEVRGGYTRVKGYERTDGRPLPSTANYYYFSITGRTGEVVVAGDTVTDGSNTSEVIEITSTYLVVTSDSTGFNPSAYGLPWTILKGAATVATASVLPSVNTGGTSTQHEAWTVLAQDSFRSRIGAVPGSGPIRGAHITTAGDQYAFRDNSGGTKVEIYKATSTGWLLIDISLNKYVEFDTGAVAEFVEGETVTFAPSGATRVIDRVVVNGGVFGTGSATGLLMLSGGAGTPTAADTFTAGTSGGTGNATTAEVAVTLPPGGRYEFVEHNFYGSSSTIRTYGANGVGPYFEFDGAILVPGKSNTSIDTPKYIEVQSNHLFLAYPNGSLQNTGAGLPLNQTATKGAGEQGVGDDITGLHIETGETLVVCTRNKTLTMTGSDPVISPAFFLKTLSENSGCRDYTIQQIGAVRYLDDRGMMDIRAVQAFGDFKSSIFSQLIEPIITDKKNSVAGSTVNRSRSHYRLFFTDRSGVYFTFDNNKLIGALPVLFAHNVEVISNGEDSTGNELTIFGSDDGFVRVLDSGTSFDGGSLSASLKLAYHHLGSPTIKKRWRKASIEVESEGLASISYQAQFSFGDGGTPSGVGGTRQLASIVGGMWNQSLWNQAVWSDEVAGLVEMDLDGVAVSMSLILASNSKIEEPYTLNGAVYHHSIRAIKR